MIEIILLTAIASSNEVGETFWDPPSQIEFRVDPVPINPLVVAPLSNEQYRILYDRACSVWARVGQLSYDRLRCKSTGTSNVTLGSDGFNVFDGIDTIAIPAAQPQAFAGLTKCNPPTGFPQSSECDIWISVTGGTAGVTPWNVSPVGPPQADGTLINHFQTTLLHEIGHAHGLFHTVIPGTKYVEESCVGSSCPVMAVQGQRDASWPNRFDWDTLAERSKIQIRKVQLAVMTATGFSDPVSNSANVSITRTAGWADISSYRTYHPPRVSCRPSADTASKSCVVALSQWAVGTSTLATTSPRFLTLNVNSSGATVSSARNATRFIEGPVDVAYGQGGRYFAIGKVSSSVSSSPNRVATFRSTVTASTNPVEELLPAVDNNRTHTEPRVSFHQPSCTYVGAWPRRDTVVVLTSFDTGGNILSQVPLDGFNGNPSVRSTTPVEISCRNHDNSLYLLGTATSPCLLYSLNEDSSVAYFDGQMQVASVQIDHGQEPPGIGSCSSAPGRGQIVSVATIGTSTMPASSLLVDSVQFGAPNSTGPDGHLILVDPSATSMNENTIGVRASATGLYQSLSFSGAFSMGTTGGAPGLPNLSSWDWNESIEAFVAVRSGDAY